MATGLALPVGVNKRGRAKLTSGDEEANQTIMTALSDNDNENAFQQDLGMGSSMVFDVSDESVRAKILTRLLNIFRDFKTKEKFELKQDTITWTEDSTNQELILAFKYIDLESDEEKTFERTFTAQS